MSAFAHWLYAFLFSPEGGGWGYPFLGAPGVEALVAVAVVLPLAIWAFDAAITRIDACEWQTLLGLLVLTFAAQLALRALAPTALGAVVESAGANGFLDVARTYGPVEFLSRFDVIVGDLPMHARANLPGKTLLFHLLLAVTSSPAVMGVLIVFASSCGALMVYYLAREWFGDKRMAVCAFAFYVFLPARIFFLPVLNVVTPLFLLAPMCLLECHFRSRRMWPLVAAGAALYALVIFEPLPLAAGLIVVAQVLRRVRPGGLTWASAASVVGAPALSLLVVYLLVRALLGFDAVAAFMTALDDARRFNAANARPYTLWAFHNLKDFFLNMGVGQSLLFVAALWNARRGQSWLAWSVVAVLLVLTVFGVNRGETVRLWIFLGVFVQIVAAQMCAARPRVFAVVLAAAIVQAAVLASSVGWITVAAN